MKTRMNNLVFGIVSMSIALILCQTCSPENEEVLPNSNPRCVDVSDQYLEAGTTISLKIFVIDADGNKLTFEFTELPEFVTSTPVAYSGDSTIIILNIAPDESIIGVYDVVYAVNDGLEGTCASSFKIDVAEKEYAPVFESIADVSLTAGRTEEVAITAIDGNADAITFSISGNPGFLSITNAVQDGNTTTAELIIAPQEISDDIIDADITLVAEDEKGTIGSIVFHLTVNEPINVVTIYFCGTGLTEDWWDPHKAVAWNGLSGFWVPELVATLNHIQIVEDDSIYNQHKFIVDGIGAGVKVPIIDLIAQGFPSGNAIRGWNECLNEAKTHLGEVTSNHIGSIKLNVVGFSRGGILAMMMAKEAEQLDRVTDINMICFDPVPGDTKVKTGNYVLNEKVRNYIGFYAKDERTNLFDPVIPNHSPSSTKIWLVRMPGSHETMVGNSQQDGHSIAFYNPVINGKFSDKLLVVSWITKVISIELLGSLDWGSIQFEWTWDRSQSSFVSNYGKMYEYNYSYMRTVSFLPFSIMAYWSGKCRWCNLFDMLAKKYNQPRCAKYMDENGSLKWAALTSRIDRQTGTQAWDSLQDLLNDASK